MPFLFQRCNHAAALPGSIAVAFFIVRTCGMRILGGNTYFAENTYNCFFLGQYNLVANRIERTVDHAAIGAGQTAELKIGRKFPKETPNFGLLPAPAFSQFF